MIAYYDPNDEEARVIVQELLDSGLLWAINHGVLHQHGYALGVSSDKDTPNLVERLIIVKVDPDDIDGEIVFSASAGIMGYKKYLDYQTEKFRNRGREQDAEGKVEDA